MRSTTKATIDKARTLRRAMTKPEAALWQVLRTRPDGLKFRRQHPIGPYVVDFYCPTARLAIEVDGRAHEMGDNPARDQARGAWLMEHGLRVLRIPAYQVLTAIEAVVVLIVRECAAEGPSTALRAVPLPIAAQQGG
jgi:very-short-patch-repair endonuclease